jgi:hypothetical protein
MTYQPKIYREQGGNRFVVASGGSADVESGGEIDIESGGALKIAGTDITTSLEALAATGAEINRAADVSARLVDLDATSLAVTTILHEGRIINMKHTAAASTLTLPAATGTGGIFKFLVGAVNTNNHIIQVANATDEFAGTLFQTDTDTSDALISMPCLAADNFDTITLNGTTKGGLIGDLIELIDLATGVWAISGHTNASGTVASPFSSAVS